MVLQTVRVTPLPRKEKHDSNLDRMNCNNSKSMISFETYIQHINCINSYLASLPGKSLITPAKYLASSTLSTSIELKHHQEVLKNISPTTSIPSSARIKFKLDSTKSNTSMPKFEEPKIKISVKVEEFRLFMKSQIMSAQEIEYTESWKKVQKEVLLRTLEFCSYLIDYFKIFLDDEHPLSP